MRGFLESIPSKVFGALCLVQASALLIIWYSNRQAKVLYGPSGHDLEPFKYLVLALSIVGIGLLLRRAWAQLLLIVASTLLGAGTIVGSIVRVPLPFTLFNVVLGLALLSPLVLGINSWKKSLMAVR
jgi:hypothetical protein